MKKLLLIIPLFLLLCMPVQAKEPDIDKEDLELIRCTCYTAKEGALTADGSKPIEGFIAGKREWLGYLCIMYENDNGKVGDLIGYFDFRDTGAGIDSDGDGKGDTIKNGKSVDVYRDSLDRCYDWVAQYGDYVYVKIIKAEG